MQNHETSTAEPSLLTLYPRFQTSKALVAQIPHGVTAAVSADWLLHANVYLSLVTDVVPDAQVRRARVARQCP